MKMNGCLVHFGGFVIFIVEPENKLSLWVEMN